jgi:hypothetical protein
LNNGYGFRVCFELLAPLPEEKAIPGVNLGTRLEGYDTPSPIEPKLVIIH